MHHTRRGEPCQEACWQVFHSDRLAQALNRHVAGLKIQLTEEQSDIAKVISEWYSKTLQNVIETLEINSLSKWQQDHPT